MLGGVLKDPISGSILHRVLRHSLETPPSNRNNQGIRILQDLGMPAVALEPGLDQAEHVLTREEASNNHWVFRIKILDEFCWNIAKDNADVDSGLVALELGPDLGRQAVEFNAIGLHLFVHLFLDLVVEGFA